MPTYARAPVEFVRGEGCADLGLGRRGVPRLLLRPLGPQRRPLPPADRRRDHASRPRRLAGSSNLYYSEPALRLAERLAESSLGGKVLPLPTPAPRRTSARSSSSASTPTRAGSTEPEIVVLDHGFHGRTLGALAATPRSSPARTSSGRCRRLRRRPARRRRGAARGRRRAHRGGDDRADPGRGRGSTRSPTRCWSRRARRATTPARCSSSTRSRRAWGGPGRCGPTSRGLRPARRDDDREGARRRPAGRRLRHDARSRRRALPAASMARPSPAAPIAAAAALAALEIALRSRAARLGARRSASASRRARGARRRRRGPRPRADGRPSSLDAGLDARRGRRGGARRAGSSSTPRAERMIRCCRR